MSEICTGIVDKGLHDSDYGENNCPDCRIAELEKLNKNLERQFVEDTAKIQELENLLSGGGPRQIS